MNASGRLSDSSVNTILGRAQKARDALAFEGLSPSQAAVLVTDLDRLLNAYLLLDWRLRRIQRVFDEHPDTTAAKR